MRGLHLGSSGGCRPHRTEPTEEDMELAKRMDAVIDSCPDKDGAKYPKEDPVGAAFCLRD